MRERMPVRGVSSHIPLIYYRSPPKELAFQTVNEFFLQPFRTYLRSQFEGGQSHNVLLTTLRLVLTTIKPLRRLGLMIVTSPVWRLVECGLNGQGEV